MSRVLTVVLIFLLGVVAALLVLGYFAYMIRSGPPEELGVRGLGAAAEVAFADQGTVTISATGLEDAMVGLGYAQAASATWPLVLYRAAATGNFSALAGAQGVSVDVVAVQLGLAEAAEAAYASLGDLERQLLDAFARGVNAGLSSESITRDPSLVLSGHVPERWLPWHTIAVERLFGWLAAGGAHTGDADRMSRPIRDALRLHDFDQSVVVTSEWPAEPGVFVRYVWGSSALPVLLEASIDAGGPTPVRGACLIGTPFFIAGRHGARAWAYLLDQSLEQRSVILDSVVVQRDHRRLTLPDGSEKLVSLLTTEYGIALGELDLTPPDSLDVVRWSGLGPVTDTEAWLGLLQDRPATFDLLRAHGAELDDGDQTIRVFGETRRLVGGRMLGESAFSAYAAQRLDSLMASTASFSPRLWFTDTYSPWARRWNPAVVLALDGFELDPIAEDARSYLRNWDFAFDGASIAASIFHAWAGEIRDTHGDWPWLDPASDRLLPEDSMGTPVDIAGSFQRAVAGLASANGTDPSLWRWEDVGAARIYFPVLGGPRAAADRRELARYSPRTILGNGHPSTPNWSPAASSDRVVPASIWEGWTRLTVRSEWTVRRWYPDVSRSIGSGRAPDENSTVTSLDVPGGRRTRLLPLE